MSLGRKILCSWISHQKTLFSCAEELLGPLTELQTKLLNVLDIVRVECYLRSDPTVARGRPLQDRAALARAFLAKAVYNIGTTRALIDRICSDPQLRRLCGWERQDQVPSEATFSRAFAEFAMTSLQDQMHRALIASCYQEGLVGHISRDSTAIQARERPAAKEPAPAKRKPGRPRKGEEPAKKERRVVRQLGMSLQEMEEDLPKKCNRGAKRNAKGYRQSWSGYKLHTDVADGGIPISCIMTSASVHDSQVAIPLGTRSAEPVTSLYDLMDSANDVEEIRFHSQRLGHVPIIDQHQRTRAGKEALKREAKAQRAAGFVPPARERYKERSTVERVFGRLKDEYGGRHVRVRGNAKVQCHLMFGMLALTVDQMVRLLG